jgi:hypothetical protein
LALKGAIVAKYDRLFLFALDQRIHPSTVTNVITGRQVLDPARKRRWAKALCRTVKELFPSESKGEE